MDLPHLPDVDADQIAHAVGVFLTALGTVLALGARVRRLERRVARLQRQVAEGTGDTVDELEDDPEPRGVLDRAWALLRRE